MIIGLSGYAGAGKDELALALWAFGWERLSFADKVKEMAYRLGWDGKKDAKGRLMLVRIGDGMREVVGEDVWVDAALPIDESYMGIHDDREDPPALTAVTDCRWQNEAQRIKDLGGKIIRINRPGVGPACDPETGVPYASDVALDDWAFDHTIQNDGDIQHLRMIARNVHRTLTHEGS